MDMRSGHFNIAAAAATLAFAAGAIAAPPTYTFDQPAGTGIFAVGDPSDTKLTDGIIGKAGWSIGGGLEWVGWDKAGYNGPAANTPINIDFDFGSAQIFSKVSVGSTQDSTYGKIILPSVEVYSWNGSAWNLEGGLVVPFTTTNDKADTDPGPHTWLDVSSLNFTAQKVRVSLLMNSNTVTNEAMRWTFADEVMFTTSPIPELPTSALALLGMVTLAVARRRKR